MSTWVGKLVVFQWCVRLPLVAKCWLSWWHWKRHTTLFPMLGFQRLFLIFLFFHSHLLENCASLQKLKGVLSFYFYINLVPILFIHIYFVLNLFFIDFFFNFILIIWIHFIFILNLVLIFLSYLFCFGSFFDWIVFFNFIS
jgi:hypothetical protein